MTVKGTTVNPRLQNQILSMHNRGIKNVDIAHALNMSAKAVSYYIVKCRPKKPMKLRLGADYLKLKKEIGHTWK